ncbi:peptidoglycan-binding domain-containing protein [Streptomyces sp. N35]|uniref:peptidoglycan-binding domain-containing protein n=1 Tax=Streptomyces sp. N35 TaxID=2795730 RepID=UPI0027DDC4C1|nr:peptidoglycan-binding domain-containing protein [Streptomyces sp. N35]
MRATRPRTLAASFAVAATVLMAGLVGAPAAAAATVSPAAVRCTLEDFIGYYCGYHLQNTYADRGDTGNKVREIQALLIFSGYSVGSSGVDGQFGSGTESAVERFQRANRLPADGIVGPNTWRALRTP